MLIEIYQVVMYVCIKIKKDISCILIYDRYDDYVSIEGEEDLYNF